MDCPLYGPHDSVVEKKSQIKNYEEIKKSLSAVSRVNFFYKKVKNYALYSYT
jgi:hypothetical protein